MTCNYCHESMRHLFGAYEAFTDSIIAHPNQIITLLWPRFYLDPEYEKLLVSN